MSLLNFASLNCLQQPNLPATVDNAGKTMIEYIWLGVTGSDLRSKTHVLEFRPAVTEDVPIISVDDADSGSGELFLKPRKLFCDPFRGNGHLLVLCDMFTAKIDVQIHSTSLCAAHIPIFKPHLANNRAPCEDLMVRASDSDASFAVEQEYIVLAPNVVPSAGGTVSADTIPIQYKTPCATAVAKVARDVAEKHLKTCLAAGINVSSINQRSSSPVWSYKIGAGRGLDVADQLWVSRFLMLRIAESEGVTVSFDPKAVRAGPMDRGRCVVEYSTKATRQPCVGLNFIQKHLEALQESHLCHSLAYGKGIMMLQSDSQFTVCLGSTAGSIAIPTATLIQKAGHYVDCRPGSNMDPYLVMTLLLSTTLKLPLQLNPEGQQARPQHESRAHSCAISCVSHAWPVPTCSWPESVGLDCDSFNSYDLMDNDLMIDELDDAFASLENSPPCYNMLSQCIRAEEGFDESSSGGSSPDRSYM